MPTIIKDCFGQYGEAFDLIMRKEFAYPILTGKKKLEFRRPIPLYCAKFLKKWRYADRHDPDYFVPKDIRCVHFHDYGNRWFLDIGIEYVDTFTFHANSLPYLHKYGHYEYDEDINRVPKRIPENKAHWMFALPVLEVIDTNLDLSVLPKGVEVYTHAIPEGYEIPAEVAITKIKESEAAKKRLQKQRATFLTT